MKSDLADVWAMLTAIQVERYCLEMEITDTQRELLKDPLANHLAHNVEAQRMRNKFECGVLEVMRMYAEVNDTDAYEKEQRCQGILKRFIK